MNLMGMQNINLSEKGGFSMKILRLIILALLTIILGYYINSYGVENHRKTEDPTTIPFSSLLEKADSLMVEYKFGEAYKVYSSVKAGIVAYGDKDLIGNLYAKLGKLFYYTSQIDSAFFLGKGH